MLDLCCYDDAPSLSLLATLTLTQANTFPRLLGHSKTAQDLYVIKTAYFLSVWCLFEIREVPSRILIYFAVKVRYFAVVSWFYYFLTRAKSLNQKRTTLVPSNRTCTRCQLNWTRSNFDSFLLFSEREREREYFRFSVWDWPFWRCLKRPLSSALPDDMSKPVTACLKHNVCQHGSRTSEVGNQHGRKSNGDCTNTNRVKCRPLTSRAGCLLFWHILPRVVELGACAMSKSYTGVELEQLLETARNVRVWGCWR